VNNIFVNNIDMLLKVEDDLKLKAALKYYTKKSVYTMGDSEGG